MRRLFLTVLALLLAFPCLALPAGAVEPDELLEEQARRFGVDRLEEAMPREAAEVMPDISPTDPGSFSDSVLDILSSALPETEPALLAALRTAASMLAVVLLCSLVTQMEARLSRRAVLLAGTLALTLLSVGSVRSMVGLGRETLESLQSFTALLIPALAAATTASGAPSSASALYAAAIFVSDLLMALVNRLLIPLLYAFLALAAANAALGDQTLSQLRRLIKRLLTNGLKLVVFLFTAFLTLTGVVAGSSDGMALKAAKLALESMVPVVGGMISDASETVLVSAQAIRSAAGAFGMVAVLAILLAPLLRMGIGYLTLRLTAALGAAVGEKPLIDLIEGVADAMGLLTGMTGACGFMLLVSCVCFLKAAAV